MKLRAFAENKARDAKKDIPEKLDIGLVGADGSQDNNNNSANNQNNNSNSNDVANNGTSQNGVGDTVMTNNGDIDPMIS